MILNANSNVHHWNYNLLESVLLIDEELHYKIHRKIRLDEKSLCYIFNGELLDTKEKHRKFILNYAKEIGYDCEIVDIDIVENKMIVG